MKIKELSKIKGAFKYIGITSIVFLIILGLFFELSVSYQEANITKANMTNMQKTIDEYNNLAIKINEETYRPVDKEQLDTVQTEILNNLAKNQLLLEKFSEKEAKKTNKKDTKISFREYDISFVGDWSKAITVVTNFTNTSDALITIEKIQISSDETNNTKSKDKINTNQTNNVKVDMIYRIYIK